MTVPLVWKSMPYFPSSPFFNKCLITLQVALPYKVAMGVHHSDLLQENMLQTAEWTAPTPVDPPPHTHWGRTPQRCSQPMAKLLGTLLLAISVQCKAPLTSNFCLKTSHEPGSDSLRAVGNEALLQFFLPCSFHRCQIWIKVQTLSLLLLLPPLYLL